MRLRNKVGIVTGGGSGLGAATSILFAKEGADVLVADIRYTAAQETAKKNQRGRRISLPVQG